MSDIFNSEQTVKLLTGKTLIFIGASVTRGLYKDLIWLLNSNTLLPRQILGQKGEARFPDFSMVGDEYAYKIKQDRLEEEFCGTVPQYFTMKLINRAGLNRGRAYQETREYINDDHGIKICFK